MSMKLLQETKVIEALSAVMTAQERSERSLSYIDITGYESGLIGRGVRCLVEQIDVCVQEISALLNILRESDDLKQPELYESPTKNVDGAANASSASADNASTDASAKGSAESADTASIDADEQERYWKERMRLVHAVERCSLRVDAARAAGDVAFMDGMLEIRDTGMPLEEQAALTDIFLSLKDVYDAAQEAAEILRLHVARDGTGDDSESVE